MAGENLGAAFSIDITNLKAGLAQANRLIRESESEFKAAAAGMDDWSKSQEGLEAKLKNLNTTADLQEKKVNALKDQYKELIAGGLDPASTKAVSLRTQINKETESLNKSEKAIRDTETALEQLGTESKEAADNTKKVADSAKDMDDGFTVAKGAIAGFIANGLTALVGAAKNAITSVLGLAESTREYRTELAKMETAATQAGANTDYIKDKWHDMGAVLGDEGAVAEGLNNLLAAGFTTQEQMDAITGHLEGAAIKWKDTLKFEGLADGLQETLATGAAVGSFGEMLERSGVNLETFDEGLAACTTEAEKQNYVLDQLSKLGLNEVSEAYRTQNADLIAANQANAQYNDNMAALGEKIEPITTKIREGFNGILEKVIELVNGVDLTAFGAQIDAAFTVLTDDVLPAVVDGLGWIVNNKDVLIAGLAGIAAGFAAFKVVTLIQGVVDAMKGMTVAQYALNLAMSLNPIGLVVAAIAALVAAFIYAWNNIDGFKEFWVNLWEKIKETAAAVGEWLKTFFTETIPGWFTSLAEKAREFGESLVTKFREAWQNIVNFFTEGIPAFLEKIKQWFADLPYKLGYLVGQLIGHVISFYQRLWQFATEDVPNFIKKVVEWFAKLPGEIWTWLKNAIAKIGEFATNIANQAKTAGTNFINNTISFFKQLPGKVWEWLKSTVTKAGTFAKDLAKKGTEAAKGLFDNIVTKIEELPGKMLSLGTDIVKGLWNGINDMAGWIGKKIKSFGDGVLSGIKDFFGIESPSKLMRDEVGKNLALGVGEGFERNIDGVNRTLNAALDVGGKTTPSGSIAANGTAGSRGGVVVNQHNHFSQAHSRAEIHRVKKQTAAAVRVALATQ